MASRGRKLDSLSPAEAAALHSFPGSSRARMRARARQRRTALASGARSHRQGRLIGAGTISTGAPLSAPLP
jgi:hypothetical protein